MRSLPWIDRLGLRLSYSKWIDGIWVGILGGKDAAIMGKVEAALELVRSNDPLRYRRITRDLERIWVCGLIGARGQYDAAVRMCRLDVKYVETSPPESVASTIVHEATHGYPCMRKIGYPEALRHRIEQICFRQEILFVEKLPSAVAEVAGVRRNMARGEGFWTNESFRERWPDQMKEAAKFYGVPDWVLASARGIADIRWRLRKAMRAFRGLGRK